MATGDPEPQIELVRQLILTGDLDQLNAQLDLEAGLSTDHTFRQLKRITLTLFGPIVRGTSTCWLIHDGPHPVLSSYRCTRERTLIHFDPWHFSVSPDATVQQVYDQIAASDVDPCRVLRVGLLCAIPLPQDRLRVLFAVAGFENPSLFWLLVDGLTAELDGLDFHPADPSCAPPLDEPGSPASTQQDRLADEAQPWMQIPDDLYDRQMLELWWSGFTVPQIAARLHCVEKTLRNRFSKLRDLYGTDIVPTAKQLRKMGRRID